MIKCGNCGECHETVAQVRGCYAGQPERSSDWGAWSSADRERAWHEGARQKGQRSARERDDQPPICDIHIELDDGIYRNPTTGDIFKVYHTVYGANQQVAKRLRILPENERRMRTVRGKLTEVRAEFIYEGKRGLRDLDPSMRMTLEQAKQYGAVYGVCVRCAATLTREDSIERAMGPVCAGKI